MNDTIDKIQEITKECIQLDRDIDRKEALNSFRFHFGNTLTSILSFCRTSHINSKKTIIVNMDTILFINQTLISYTIIFPNLHQISGNRTLAYLICLIFMLLPLIKKLIIERNSKKYFSDKIKKIFTPGIIKNIQIDKNYTAYYLYKLNNIKNILKMDYQMRGSRSIEKIILDIDKGIERLTYINRAEGKNINLCSNIDSYLYVEEQDVIDIISDETIDLYFFINTVDLNLKLVQDNLKYVNITTANLEQLIYNLNNDFYPNHKKIQLFFSLIESVNIGEDCRDSLEKIIGVEQTVAFYQRNCILVKGSVKKPETKILNYLEMKK